MTTPAAVRCLLILAVASWPVSGLATGSALAAQQGVAAPAQVSKELQAALAQAAERFEARDVAGVLTWVSDRYRTGALTKSGLREQLIAIYSIYDAVSARIRIDEVRMVDGHAWVYSTGEVSGQLPLVGTWVVFLSWQHELEVARREAAQWRLFGYQQ
jgi:hypothetical protein